jgi:uncharacterized protein
MNRTILQRGLSCLALLVATSAAAAPPSHQPPRPDAAKGAAATKGRAFVEMAVAGVVPTPDGTMVVLVNADEQVLLPLGIGLSEAISIHGRLEHHRFARPQTHDLLDHVLTELGGRIVKVQIDDLREDVFLGTVFIKAGDRVISVDARPSDAIALAVGSGVPILVARAVLDRAALTPDDLLDEPEAAPTPDPAAAAAEPAGVYTL